MSETVERDPRVARKLLALSCLLMFTACNLLLGSEVGWKRGIVALSIIPIWMMAWRWADQATVVAKEGDRDGNS